MIPKLTWLAICCSGDETLGPTFEINSQNNIVLRDETEHEVRSTGIDENGEFDWNYALVGDGC